MAETVDLVLGAPLTGWAAPLDEVPDPVFAGRLLGDGMAIDPLDGRLVAPCAGVVRSVHDARHAVTLVADNGAELLMHVGIDTVALGGAGFVAAVAAGQRVAAGDVLLRFDPAQVAAQAASLMTPLLLVNEGYRIVRRAAPGPVAAGAPLMTIARVAQADGDMPSAVAAVTGGGGGVVRRRVVVPLAHGIHARPAARLAAAARGFRAELRLATDGGDARLASPTALLALSVRHGDGVEVSAAGDDAEAAVAAIVALIAGGMGEGGDSVPAPVPVPAPVAAVPARAAAPGVLHGVTAAPGLAIGRAFRLDRADPVVAEAGAGHDHERAAFADARSALRATLDRQAQAPGAQGAIAQAHAAFLDDPDLIDATMAAIADGASAGHGWRQVLRREADRLRRAPDPRIAERADDLRDLERQLLAVLAGAAGGEAAVVVPDGAILIADDLLPSQLSALDTARIAGIATARGGPTSHVAIIAAGLGLPTLVAIGPALAAVADGAALLLDADGGTLEPSPAAARVAAAEAMLAERAHARAAAAAGPAQGGRTADGHPIAVMANLASAADAARAVAEGAEGCGLLRTELLFLDRPAAPDEDEQARDYGAIAAALDGRPLIVRLLDIGGDKPAPYLPIGPEENPALGLRGIRVGLAHPALLKTQIRAILRAGRPGQCRIMIPMVAGLAELAAVRAVVTAAAAELGIGHPVELGIMVETPAAAVMADRLAELCDFLSVGSNDLTQYALARDRGNPAVAAGVDGLDPAVLRLIRQTCDGAAGSGRWVGVCGGLASDPLAVPILIGLGVTELSATPAMVGQVRALVARIAMPQARALAAAALACADAAAVRALARDMLEETGR